MIIGYFMIVLLLVFFVVVVGVTVLILVIVIIVVILLVMMRMVFKRVKTRKCKFDISIIITINVTLFRYIIIVCYHKTIMILVNETLNYNIMYNVRAISVYYI